MKLTTAFLKCFSGFRKQKFVKPMQKTPLWPKYTVKKVDVITLHSCPISPILATTFFWQNRQTRLGLYFLVAGVVFFPPSAAALLSQLSSLSKSRRLMVTLKKLPTPTTNEPTPTGFTNMYDVAHLREPLNSHLFFLQPSFFMH